MSLFLAVWPDQPTIERLAALARPERRGVRWTDSGHWHITLAFLGPADADAAAAALARLGATAGGARVGLGPVTRLLNRTVLIVPAHGLEDLAAAARSACTEANLALEERPYRGHLTLARGRRPGDLAGLAGEPVEARFEAGAVDLVQSTRVPEGGPNRYDVVGRQALVGPPRVGTGRGERG